MQSSVKGGFLKEICLVTGGAGFIGSHVVEALLEDGLSVRALDNMSTGHERNLSGLRGDLDVIVGDIRDAEAVRNACRNVTTVFHLAAYISVPGSVREPALADAVNIQGTLNLLLAARDAGVQRFVFSSSAAVVGEPETLPVDEHARTRPGSPYGVEKLYGEHMCRLFSGLYGLSTIALRYFNVFGPRQNPESEYAAVIPKFVSCMAKGEQPTIYGDGEQTRDFLYVKDVARANLLAARVPASGLTVNVASGRSVSVRELFDVIATITGYHGQPRYSEPRPGDIKHSAASVRRAAEVLGFSPRVSLEDGLRETARWLCGEAN